MPESVKRVIERVQAEAGAEEETARANLKSALLKVVPSSVLLTIRSADPLPGLRLLAEHRAGKQDRPQKPGVQIIFNASGVALAMFLQDLQVAGFSYRDGHYFLATNGKAGAINVLAFHRDRDEEGVEIEPALLAIIGPAVMDHLHVWINPGEQEGRRLDSVLCHLHKQDGRTARGALNLTNDDRNYEVYGL